MLCKTDVSDWIEKTKNPFKMNTETKEWQIKNRQTELQMVYDLATKNNQNAKIVLAMMNDETKMKTLKNIIASSSVIIEICKERAIKEGLLHIL